MSASRPQRTPKGGNPAASSSSSKEKEPQHLEQEEEDDDYEERFERIDTALSQSSQKLQRIENAIERLTTSTEGVRSEIHELRKDLSQLIQLMTVNQQQQALSNAQAPAHALNPSNPSHSLNRDRYERQATVETEAETIELPDRSIDSSQMPQSCTLPQVEMKVLGYFEPNESKEAMQTREKEVVFADVNAFVRQLKRLARAFKVVTLIPLVLRGDALSWYNQLPWEQSEEIANHWSLNSWIAALRKNFSIKRETAWIKLYQEMYYQKSWIWSMKLIQWLDQVTRYSLALGYDEEQIKDVLFMRMDREIASDFMHVKNQSLSAIRFAFDGNFESIKRKYNKRVNVNGHFFEGPRPPGLPAPGSLPAPTKSIGWRAGEVSVNKKPPPPHDRRATAAHYARIDEAYHNAERELENVEEPDPQANWMTVD